MKKALGLVLLMTILFVATAANAFEITYCIRMTLTETATKQLKSNAACTVTQTFAEDDGTSIWNCSFTPGTTEVLKTSADRTGMSPEWGLYAEHLIYKGSDLGQFFFRNFALKNVENNSFFQVTFPKEAPKLLKDTYTILADPEHTLHVDGLSYETCQ